MTVEKHLLNDIKPLSPGLQVKEVLDLMEELKFSHLPLSSQEGKYLGLICEDDLLEVENDEQSLIEHQRIFRPYSININGNMFEAIRITGEGNLSFLPVVDGEGNYKGYISPLELLQDIGRQITFRESGSTLMLELSVRDFQLSQIAQIVESEDARITGFMMDDSAEMDQVYIQLKINQRDISRILKSFERYNYKVAMVQHETMFDDTIDTRYQALMKYLNIGK